MIVVIVGPTGVGKTKLSIELAKKMNAEIINADSMQVYKGLDIVTAKVKEEEKEGIVHHLLDICDVEDNYTVYDYQRDGRKKIEEIQGKRKNIIIVGGTGLYIRALLYDYKFEEENQKYDFSNYSNEELLQEIEKFNSNCTVHPNNRQRLERYLTKCYQNSNTSKENAKPLYDFVMIGLTTSREELYKRINNRVEEMMMDGMVEEARKFYDKKIYSKALTTGIGYKELYQYFDGKISLEEATELIQKNSRHYAKRQYTFFNNQFPVHWFETNYENFSMTVQQVVEYLQNFQE